MAAFIVWLILFHNDKSVLIIANKKDVAKNTLKKVKLILKNLPTWMYLADVSENNIHSLVLSNGSSVKSVARSDDAGRSEAVSLLVLDEAAHIERMDELWKGAASTISCLSGDTKIFTNKGIIKLGELCKNLSPGEYKPYMDENLKVYNGSKFVKISHLYKTPKTNGLKIKTRRGFEVEVTPEHPLYKLTKNIGRMTKSHELKIGDFLRIDNNISSFGSEDENKDLCYLMGLYTSEGFFEKYRPNNDYAKLSICNQEPQILKFLKNSKKFLGKNFVISSAKRQNVLVLRDSQKIRWIIKRFGVNPKQKAWDKTVPSEIWKLSKECIQNYLQGVFDGDGCACSRGIILATSSERLVKEIQLILLNFGIIANIYKKSKEKILEREIRTGRLLPQGKQMKSCHDAYQLVVPHSQTQKFIKEIGFRLDRKSKKAEQIISLHKQDETKLYKIPTWAVRDKINEMMKESKLIPYHYRKNGLRIDKLNKDSDKKERFITVNFIQKLKEIFEKESPDVLKENLNFFQEFLGSKTWDDIVSIESVENQYFYDLTVPDGHRFTQNGILGSNTGGKVIAISTPNGMGNWFHEYFTKADSGEIEWAPFTTHWWENPDYAQGLEEDKNTPGGWTSPWFRKTTAGWTRFQIAQELLTSFIESGNTFFETETISKYMKLATDPIEKTGFDQGLWIWKKPRSGYRYLISADSALGSGEDSSAAHVIELQDLEVVAEYKGKMPPDVFGEFLIELAERYNNAYICPEGGNQSQVGQVTCFTIKNQGYRNLCYFDSDTGKLLDQWTAEYKGVAPGLSMTLKNRSSILAKFEEFIRKDFVKTYSKRLVAEMTSFIIKNSKPQAEKGMTDDLIMSLAIGVWVRDVCPEFRSSTTAADMIKMFQAAQKNVTPYSGGFSRDAQIRKHKERIRHMIDQQKVPIRRPNMPLIYKG